MILLLGTVVVVLLVAIGVAGSPVGPGRGARSPLLVQEDFDTPAAPGSFTSTYTATMGVYPTGWRDTSGVGVYRPDDVLSVHDGVLDFHLRTVDGEPAVAAVVPDIGGGAQGAGQTYGRYSVRLRADGAVGYKLAFLLWPDSESWPDDGEIDFPDADLTEQFSAFAHHANPGGGVDEFPAGVTFDEWHTATTEWSPGRVDFLLDGRLIGSSTTDVPDHPMHFVLQTETSTGAAEGGPAPDAQSEAHVYVDSVSVESYPWNS